MTSAETASATPSVFPAIEISLVAPIANLRDTVLRRQADVRLFFCWQFFFRWILIGASPLSHFLS
ncbi:MAG: hypothetical protein V3T62_09270 [Alphaproteobacteria bacterium]